MTVAFPLRPLPSRYDRYYLLHPSTHRPTCPGPQDLHRTFPNHPLFAGSHILDAAQKPPAAAAEAAAHEVPAAVRASQADDETD